MATSTKIKGLSKHMNQIFGAGSEKWEGVDFTLRKEVIVTDSLGKRISSSNTDTTIKGVISAIPFANEEMAGLIENRQVRGNFLWTSTAEKMPEIEDKILDDTEGRNITYAIVDIPHVDWDINDPVLITATLREVPDEH